MKIVIIDDELYARKALEEKLARFCPNLEIVAIEDGAVNGYNAILEHKPDIVFLDIAMPTESGFDMLYRFDEINFEIIFVTGFDKYAINAIEFSAVGYILKPINTDELIRVVQRAEKRISNKSENERIKILLENIKHLTPSKLRLAIPSMTAVEFVKVSTIIRIEGMEKLTGIYIQERKRMVSSYNIGEFRKLLANHNFYSPHRSHFINMDHIKKYYKEGVIEMVDGSTVPVSKRKKSEFLEIMRNM